MIEKEKPRHFYDLESGTLIKGETARQRYFKKNGDSPYVRPLSEILTNPEIELPPFEYKRKPKKRSKQSILKYGRWICEVVAEEPAPSGQRRDLNYTVLQRAGRLGIGPSIHEIKKHPSFRTLGRFYVELGLSNTNKTGVFDDWVVDDYAKYIIGLAHRLGRKPTADDIIRSSQENPANPSRAVITSRLGSIGALNELAGYPNIREWKKEDYTDWGVKFIRANHGVLPAQYSIDYLSKKKFGPSAALVAQKFNNSLVSYQTEVGAEFDRRAVENNALRLQKIEEALSGQIPSEVFESTNDENEILLRLARYRVLDELFGDRYPESKLSISTMNNPTVAEMGFVRSIRKINDSFTAGDIESTAASLSVFDDIWPPDMSYMENLRIPEEELSASDREKLAVVRRANTVL